MAFIICVTFLKCYKNNFLFYAQQKNHEHILLSYYSFIDYHLPLILIALIICSNTKCVTKIFFYFSRNIFCISAYNDRLDIFYWLPLTSNFRGTYYMLEVAKVSEKIFLFFCPNLSTFRFLHIGYIVNEKRKGDAKRKILQKCKKNLIDLTNLEKVWA